MSRRKGSGPTGGPGVTSQAGGAHVADLLLVELPLLAVERQRRPSAAVGAAEADHLLERPLHEVNPRLILQSRRL